MRFDENSQTHKDSNQVGQFSDGFQAQQDNKQSKSDEQPQQPEKTDEQVHEKPTTSDNRFNRNWKHESSHSKGLIIGNINDKIRIKSTLKETINTLALISKIEPKSTEEAL